MNLDQTKRMLDQMADLLEKSGHSPEEARLIAAEMLTRQAEVSPGCSWGGVHAEFIPQLWTQATAHGNKRRLLLEITCEGESYEEYHHIRALVKGAQTWAEYEAEQRELREKEVN